MDRIGEKLIFIPEGISFDLLGDGREVCVKNPRGSVTLDIPMGLKVIVHDNQMLSVKPRHVSSRLKAVARRPLRKSRIQALRGSFRTQLQNAIFGLSSDWYSVLELSGLGYTASAINSNCLQLSVGLSHKIEVNIEAPMEVSCPTPQQIRLAGPDLVKLTQCASSIRSLRTPDAYHGKGVRWSGEIISLKEGKKPQAL